MGGGSDKGRRTPHRWVPDQRTWKGRRVQIYGAGSRDYFIGKPNAQISRHGRFTTIDDGHICQWLLKLASELFKWSVESFTLTQPVREQNPTRRGYGNNPSNGPGEHQYDFYSSSSQLLLAPRRYQYWRR